MKALAASYRFDGYAVIRGLLDAGTVADCRDHLTALRRSLPVGPIVAVDPSGGWPGRPRRGGSSGADVAPAHARLQQVAEGLLGGPVDCFGLTYIVKAPGGDPAMWHQDGYPWRTSMGIGEALTLWAALDDCDEENGCLQVIPASHRGEARPLEAVGGGVGGGEAGAGMFGGGIFPEAELVATTRPLIMRAGDVSAHHPCLVHGSGPNRSGGERAALVLRYRPAR